MTRNRERLIDVFVLAMLLAFSFGMRSHEPALSGVIVAGAVQFWMAKNADPSPSPEDH
jgi:hypothetical protein